MGATFTLPADNQAVHKGSPASDMNAVVDAIKALGAMYSALNAANAGGATPGGTVDTAAAISAAAARGVAVLPPGTFLLNGAAGVTGGSVRGMGAGLTTLQVGPAFTGLAAVTLAADNQDCVDLAITGQSSTVTANPGCAGVLITGAKHCRADRLWFQYVNGWCIDSTATAGAANLDTMITTVTGRNCAAGIRVKGAAGSGFGGEHFLSNIQLQQIGAASGPAANLDAVLVEDAADVELVNVNAAVTDTAAGATLHVKGACSSVLGRNLDLGVFPNGAGSNSVILIEDSANGSPSDCDFAGGVAQEGSAGLTISGGASNIRFGGFRFVNNLTHGVVLSGSGSLLVFDSGCRWAGNGAGAGGGCFDINVTGTATGYVRGCYLTSPVVATGPGVANPVALASSGQALEFHDTALLGSGTTVGNAFTNLPRRVRNCQGYNPHGAVVVAVPASGSATGALHYDAVFYVTAAAGGQVSITRNTNGAGGGTGPAVVIPAGQSEAVWCPAQGTLTYTYGAGNAPTQVVDGQ